MNRILLLLIVFLPVLGFGQQDLLKWRGNSFTPQVLNTNIATANGIGTITATGVSLQDVQYGPFFQMGGLPTPQQNSGGIDTSKYIEFKIKPKTGYMLDLTSFNFESKGNGKFQVRYSKNPLFTSNVHVLPENTSSSNFTSISNSLTALGTIYDNETVYIRVYAYNTWNTFELRHSWGGTTGPTIRGTVSVYAPPVLTAVNDTVNAISNNFTTVSVLTNDIAGSNPITGVNIASQPVYGTVTVNTNNTIKFVPTSNYTGTTTFTYTITDSSGATSAPATVTVNVANPVAADLVRWNGASQQPTPQILASNMTAANIAVNGITMANNGNTWNGFTFNNLSPNTISYGGYIEFAITANAGHKITPESFKFRYLSTSNENHGPKKYQVRFSTEASFPSNGIVLVGETATVQNVDTDVTVNFPEGTVVGSEQTLRVRIYAYDNNQSYSNFQLKHDNGGTVGPAITGIVAEYNVNDINANGDVATTNEGQSVNINVLANDTSGATAVSSVVIATPPVSGTAVVNPDKTITYNPGSFVGTTTFDYTISNSSASATGTVTVTVNPIVDGKIVVWHGGSPSQATPFLLNENIVAANITAPGLSLSTGQAGNFRFNNMSASSTVNYSKYIQFSTSPVTGYKIAATKFEFNYYSPSASDQGPKKYQVRYSKDSSFPSNGTVLIGETSAIMNTSTTVSLTFPEDLVVLPTETLYIRIYPYHNSGSYSDYYIRHNNGGLQGPSISGLVIPYSPVVLSAVNDTAVTEASTPVVINVLENDVVGTAAVSNISIPSQPSNGAGAVVVNGYANVTFTPASGFSGETSFIYTIYNGTAYSSATVNVTVNAPVITEVVWNGTQWTGGQPSLNTDVTIIGNYDTAIDGDLLANELVVNAGTELRVSALGTVMINNQMTINGTLIVEDDANLIQINDAAAALNTGTVQVERESSPVKQYDYVYWSTPVSGTEMWELSSPSVYYSFNPLVNNWNYHYDSEIMTTGVGYIAMAQEDMDFNAPLLPTVNKTFSGAQNSGVVNVPLQGTAETRFNLVGNPYPSAIDAEAFILANQNLIDGTLYFWTHQTAISANTPGTEANNYTADDYAKFNLVGGVGTGEAPEESTTPDGNIGSCQGFYVKVRDDIAVQDLPQQLLFNNSMRVGGNSNTLFYKAAPTTVDQTIYKNRIWLNISNTQGAYAETLLGYITGATNGLDHLYDGKTLPAGNFVSLYSLLETQPLVIQGRSLPFNDADVIPLGFSSTIAGTFSISLKQFDGVFHTQGVYLVDKTTNTYTNLKEINYTFQTSTGTFANRFELRFLPNAALSNNTPVVEQNAVTIFKNGNQIQVSAKEVGIKQVIVYDLQGKVIVDQQNINAQSYITTSLNVSSQVVIVKVIADNDAEVVKKVMME